MSNKTSGNTFDLAEKFANENQFVSCYMNNNCKDKMHTHEFYEINMIVKGSGTHRISESELPANTGDIFVIPPHTLHGYYTDGRMDIFHIVLKKDFIERYREELMQVPGFGLFFDIEPYIREASGMAYNLNLTGSELIKLKRKMKNIAETELTGAYMYENLLVLNLIAEMCVLTRDKISRLNSKHDSNIDIIMIMEYVKQNMGAKLTLAELSEYGNMSIATLNRRFKSFLNTSPMKYIIRCRIHAAQEMLHNKKFNKSEIARKCGFYDLAHLNKYLDKNERNENIF